MDGKKTQIPEVEGRANNSKKVAGVIVGVLGFIFIIYANTATSKKTLANTTAKEVAPVLSFHESSDPVFSKRAREEQKRDSLIKKANIEISQESNEPSIDPEKLMQFKKMMDNANEKKMREIVQRRRSKTLIFINNASENQASSIESSKPKSFIEEVDKTTKVVSATRTTNLSNSILEGTIIHATLETAVNSDLPGSMRAVVNRTVYSADGMNKLLNPGDRLVMKYTSKVTKGATRVFAVGTRIIKSDGVSINIGSEVASPLGVVGLGASSVDTHFFERFSESALLAVISAGAATMNVSDSDQYNSLSMYRSSIADSFADSAANSLSQNKNIPPTLYVDQGREITVFVAKDINFDEVYGGQA